MENKQLYQLKYLRRTMKKLCKKCKLEYLKSVGRGFSNYYVYKCKNCGKKKVTQEEL